MLSDFNLSLVIWTNSMTQQQNYFVAWAGESGVLV